MKTLIVRDFGPIKNIEIELKDINLFIGEQSVGKSTVAKIITILTDHISLMSIIKNDMAEWNRRLAKYNLDIYKDDAYIIIYEMDNDDFTFHFEIQSGALDIYVIKDGNRIEDRKLIFKEIVASKIIYHDEAFDTYMKLSESKKDGYLKAFENLMSNSLYIPAERIIYSVINNLLPALTLAESSIPGNLLRFMVELQNAKSTYPEFEMPLLGISYKKEDSDDYFVITSNHRKLPVSAASSGIQSTMPLLQVIHYAIRHKEYSTFVIEEPECNLFPEKQVELLEYILRLTKDEERTLIITTHSPYVLSAMNNYLYAGGLLKDVEHLSRNDIGDILKNRTCVLPEECSVYSLGENINGDGVYCKSLMDPKSGMIDFNSLDAISNKLGQDFEALEDLYVDMLKG